jgi:hypothetical protein
MLTTTTTKMMMMMLIVESPPMIVIVGGWKTLQGDVGHTRLSKDNSATTVCIVVLEEQPSSSGQDVAMCACVCVVCVY